MAFLKDSPNSICIGLTGPIGSGKSTVAKYWKTLGAAVVEGDAVGKMVLETDTELKHNLSIRFGADILHSNGSVNRKLLGERAFANKENQEALLQLTHKPLLKLADAMIEEQSEKHSVVIFDAALIIEWGIQNEFALLVVVTASEKLLVDRAMERLYITQKEAENRLKTQISPTVKVQMADIVIHNNHSVKELKFEAKRIWDEYIIPKLETKIK